MERTDLSSLADLVAVMDRLRSPGGCPWDAEQTHESLVPYAVEEVHELVEAVETGDRTGMREELGDLLLQVVFHARVAAEHPTDPFDLDDVAADIAAKLRRRHPHVFGDRSARDAAHVAERWEQLKREEKSRTSALDGIPPTLPALARAQKVAERAGRLGIGPEAPDDDVLGRADAPDADPAARILGRTLLSIAAGSPAVDAEAALRSAVRELENRVRTAEQVARVDE